MFHLIKMCARNNARFFLVISLPLCVAAQNLFADGSLRSVSAPAPAGYDIVFVGDSITAGATLSDSATEASPVRCVENLRTRLHSAVRMSNQGHSGHTTVDWLPSNNPSSDFQLAIAAAATLQIHQPGQLIFSIMLGANDSAERGPNGSPVSPADYSHNMLSLMDQLLTHYPDALVVVQYPTWYSTNTQNSSLYGSAGLARLESYFPELDHLISDGAVKHPGHIFPGDRLAFNFFSKNYLADLTPESGAQGTFYLHPNSAGAMALGKFWADAIATTLHLPTNGAYAAGRQSHKTVSEDQETGFDKVPVRLHPQ